MTSNSSKFRSQRDLNVKLSPSRNRCPGNISDPMIKVTNERTATFGPVLPASNCIGPQFCMEKPDQSVEMSPDFDRHELNNLETPHAINKDAIFEHYKDMSQMIPDEPKAKTVIGRLAIDVPKIQDIKPLITTDTRYITKPMTGNMFKVYLLDTKSDTVKGVYEGEMRNDFPEGHGKVAFEDGTIYEGNWLRGEYQGKGKLMHSQFTYEGSLKDSLFDGEGKLTIKQVGEYEGMFMRGRFCGYGIFKWLKGKVYKGHWKDSSMHLKGMMAWPDGRRYIGGFSMGKKEGKGFFYFAGGMMIEARWRSGTVEHVFQKREGVYVPELLSK